MTSFLRLNGITVPVSPDSAALEPKDIGAEMTAEDGTPLFNRRGTKNTWSVRSTVRTAAEALAFKDLVLGEGQVINFNNQSFYSFSGLPPTVVGGGWTIVTTLPKYGSHRAAHTANNLTTYTPFTSSSPWSILLWRTTDGGTTWNHWVLRSDGTKWLNGVVSLAASAFCTVSSGVVTLGNDVAGGFDDVVFLPYLVPTTWPAQIHGFGYAFGTLPRLTADGLFIEQNLAGGVATKGRAGALRAVKTRAAADMHDFAFELLEV